MMVVLLLQQLCALFHTSERIKHLSHNSSEFSFLIISLLIASLQTCFMPNVNGNVADTEIAMRIVYADSELACPFQMFNLCLGVKKKSIGKDKYILLNSWTSIFWRDTILDAEQIPTQRCTSLLLLPSTGNHRP